MRLIMLFLFLAHLVVAQQSHDVTFEHDDKTVYATLLTPEGSGPFPTIIIAPGSGPNDRNGTLTLVGGNAACLHPDLLGQTLTPYKELAEALADSGYAVLRYDKIEFTYGSNLGTITFHKIWLPVKSAIDFLKTRTDVDSTRIILIGHSEGSTLIPFIAKARSDIRALISIAGARTPFDSILARQLVDIARTCNGDTTLAKNQAAQILAYFNLLRSDTWTAQTPPLFGVPAAVWDDYVDATDPVADNYNSTAVPTLFIGLGLDFNVPPTELERFADEVTITDDFWSIPGLIHYMTPSDDPHVSKVLTDTILFWLRQQGLTTSIEKPSETVTVEAFPNPFTDTVTVALGDKSASTAAYHLYTSDGKLITSGTRPVGPDGTVQLNLNAVKPGNYILELISGIVHVNAQLVKQ